jgi:hypothetical protein
LLTICSLLSFIENVNYFHIASNTGDLRDNERFIGQFKWTIFHGWGDSRDNMVINGDGPVLIKVIEGGSIRV